MGVEDTKLGNGLGVEDTKLGNGLGVEDTKLGNNGVGVEDSNGTCGFNLTGWNEGISGLISFSNVGNGLGVSSGNSGAGVDDPNVTSGLESIGAGVEDIDSSLSGKGGT